MKDKVIFLIGTLSDGGAERVVSNLSLNLHNVDTEIILFGYNAKVEYDYDGKIIYLDRDASQNFITKLSTLLKRIYKLNKIKKENPNTRVISFLEYPNLLNMLTFDTKNSIVSVRNFMSTKHKKGFKSFLWNKSVEFLYRRAERIIVVSKDMKRDLVNNYKLKSDDIKVIYNFYSVDKIRELSKENLTINERKVFTHPTVITVGRLNEQKGQKHLLHSFRIVKERIPNAQLIILGEGKLKSELINLASNMGIADSVHFWGFKKNPFKYISASKVFVMSSYFEGFPNALAEAMACMTPVISTDCKSGPREILAPNDYGKSINYEPSNERYGLLIPNPATIDGDTVEKLLANSIIDVLSQDKVYQNYSRKSLERIKDFDVKHIISEWIDIF